jgi:hypothetical protein
MRATTKVGGALGGLFTLMAMVAAVIAAVIALVVFVVVALAALVAVASAAIAYFKRDTWTKPAYRWARDKSGRWSRTPWSAGDSAAPEEDAPIA